MTDAQVAGIARHDRRARRHWTAALSVVLLLVAACGDDEDGADGSVASSGSGWNGDPAVATVISDAGGEQVIPKIVASGSDSFTVSWFSNPEITNYDVRLQRYDAAANELWEPGGLVVSDQTSDTFITDYVAAGDDEGNTILVFQDRRTGSSDIHAYKISPDGEQLWGDEGIALTSGSEFEAPRPTFVVDGGELTFSFVRDVDADSSEVVVQRLAPDGSTRWGEGVVLRGGAGERYGQPVVAEGPDDGIYVAYTVGGDFATGEEALQLQRIDAAGTTAWDDPVELAPELPLPAESSLLPDGSGGVYAAWNDTDLRAHIQHVDPDGTPSFGDDGAQPSSEPGRLQIGPRLTSVDGGPVVVWLDTDEGQSERGVSAQRLDQQGTRQWGDSGLRIVEPTRAELGSIAPIAAGPSLRVYFAQGEAAGDEPSLLTRLDAIDVSPDGDVANDRIPVSSRPAEISNVEVAAVDDMHVVVWNERDGDDLDALMQNVQTP